MSENSAPKILITGVHGQLGRALAGVCAERGIDFEGRDIDTLDICDAAAVTEWIEGSKPYAVINCAAFTAVDDCESDEQSSSMINGCRFLNTQPATPQFESIRILFFPIPVPYLDHNWSERVSWRNRVHRFAFSRCIV